MRLSPLEYDIKKLLFVLVHPNGEIKKSDRNSETGHLYDPDWTYSNALIDDGYGKSMAMYKISFKLWRL